MGVTLMSRSVRWWVWIGTIPTLPCPITRLVLSVLQTPPQPVDETLC